MKDLSDIRKEIDKVDDELANILCKRADLARKVREVKTRDEIRSYLPSREKEIVKRVIPKCVAAGFSEKSVEEIFLSIISASRSIVGDFEVCFPGIMGSSCHAALVKQFGPLDNYRCVDSISACIDSIDKDVSRYGVFPFSSSGSGIKTETLELLINREIKIVSSVELEETFSIYSSEPEISKIKKIYLPAYEQIKFGSWISKYAPNADVLFIKSDLHLVSLIKESKIPNSGLGIVLTGNFSLELGLNELVTDVSAASDYSRYFVVEKGVAQVKASSIVSIVCAAKNTTGILRQILSPFSSRDIPLTVIESRKPKSAAWDCLFYIEADARNTKEDLNLVIDELALICSYVKVLGSPTS